MRAWNVLPAEHLTCVGAWLLHAPGVHAFWDWRYLSVVHLRTVPGMGPAKLVFPEATHEVQLLSIDPERCPKPDPDIVVHDGAPYLMPPDVVQQVGGLDDVKAARLGELCVRACVAGELIPDEDFVRAWRRVIIATTEHLATGGHGSQA